MFWNVSVIWLLNFFELFSANFSTNPVLTHELKASQFFHLEYIFFFLTLNGSFLELEQNRGAVYEQFFWGLSGLRNWIDTFVQGASWM